MKYEEFKNLKPGEKWFYIWESLDNHLSQIKEIKWIMRAIATGIAIYFIRFLFTH